MSAARAAPAVLQAATETATDFGGLDETWTEVATLWVTLTVAAPTQPLDDAYAPPALTDVAAGVCRDHPAAAAGQRLLIGDDPEPWRLRRVDRGLPGVGRMTLRLDRLT